MNAVRACGNRDRSAGSCSGHRYSERPPPTNSAGPSYFAPAGRDGNPTRDGISRSIAARLRRQAAPLSANTRFCSRKARSAGLGTAGASRAPPRRAGAGRRGRAAASRAPVRGAAADRRQVRYRPPQDARPRRDDAAKPASRPCRPCCARAAQSGRARGRGGWSAHPRPSRHNPSSRPTAKPRDCAGRTRSRDASPPGAARCRPSSAPSRTNRAGSRAAAHPHIRSRPGREKSLPSRGQIGPAASPHSVSEADKRRRSRRDDKINHFCNRNMPDIGFNFPKFMLASASPSGTLQSRGSDYSRPCAVVRRRSGARPQLGMTGHALRRQESDETST